MMFGPVPTGEAEGGILAHSISAAGKRLRKGKSLTRDDVAILASAGISEVAVAKLGPGDLGEDEAAGLIAKSLLPGAGGAVASAPFTGRVNLYAETAGLVKIDTRKVLEINAVDPAITLATLPDLARVAQRSMIATVKIITYGATAEDVRTAAALCPGTIELKPVVRRSASLVVTTVPGQPAKLAAKGRYAVEDRLSALGIRLEESRIVGHDPASVGGALKSCGGRLLLVLTGSATSDPRDVGPEGLRMAGGKLRRFGMPVDPGNLLFYGDLGDRPVIGLPGCARSPALNGADWVLERLACGLPLADSDFAAMGAGGLLKEIPVRPQPRAAARSKSMRPVVEAVVLGGGLPAGIEGAAAAAKSSMADKVNVIAAARTQQASAGPDGGAEREEVAAPQSGDIVELFRTGVAGLTASADAVLFIRSDRTADASQLSRLIAAFSPADGREICELSGADAWLGPAVLFGKRFFESLEGLQGRGGLDDLRREARDFIVEVDAGRPGTEQKSKPA